MGSSRIDSAALPSRPWFALQMQANLPLVTPESVNSRMWVVGLYVPTLALIQLVSVLISAFRTILAIQETGFAALSA